MKRSTAKKQPRMTRTQAEQRIAHSIQRAFQREADGPLVLDDTIHDLTPVLFSQENDKPKRAAS